MDFDVVVIGGGSAGYAAASTAQSAGAKVAIVDKGPLGGLCILRGCMPTKTILRSSDIFSLMRRAKEFGLSVQNPSADLAAINDRKNQLIAEFASYRVEQLNDPRFTLIQENASFISQNVLKVGGKTLTAKSFIIATGSSIAEFPVNGLAESGYLTSDDILELRQAPESMIVLGAGPVAVELAQFFCRIGTRTTLIQRSEHILSKGDEDLARPVEARFREEGMEVFTTTKLLRVEKSGAIRTVFFTHDGKEKSATAETILQALGRKPNIDGLNLSAAGVSTNRGRVEVDQKMRTNIPHIYAVGDVNGLHEIVHIAIEQGEVAAHNATQKESRQFDDRLKTSVTFTDPPVASVGLSEKECRSESIPYLTASYPFNDHGKSMCLGETHGHVKLLCAPDSGEIIGAHIVGPEAGEMIHQMITLMHYKGTVHDLIRIPHYHPTLSEILTYPAEELSKKL
ncbi:MAG: dihydrolipoyl dehydrogenase [Nitrospinaceae bacterium]|jgi:pyruvate/2-oxoglutarate dehydrogenase complex dihydrolipoamide dehydrogenase (E3) component|nr:dihydrolipoyl dehydrogenase [Nitrospinaceae bacterium]MDP7148188.1 dihydrolipoyl dehydrogenase [Nitrospinaceae bacterium]